jgi:hypothetical protein
MDRKPKIDEMFYFQGKYCNWWRVLPHESKHLAVELTPINGFEWDEIARIRIREFPDFMGGLNVAELPPDVRRQMARHLGAELVDRLLSEDFLSSVDWGLFRGRNEGAFLADIVRREP